MADTKKYWRDVVDAEDYDAHMIEAGQAAVNAALVKTILREYLLLTDQQFIEKLKSRLPARTDFQTLEDDLEQPKF